MALRQERKVNVAQVMQVRAGAASITSFANLTSFASHRTLNLAH